jgi:hypothetical protein
MINLNKLIYSRVSNAVGTAGLSLNGIYTIIIPEFAVMPCVVYERFSTLEYTKDGRAISDNTVDINVITGNYPAGIDIAMKVDEYMSMASQQLVIDNTTYNIFFSKLLNVAETYQEDCYIQKLTYSMKLSVCS